MAGHLDMAGTASLLTSYRPGLEMLLAPMTPGDAEKVPPRLVGELLAVLRSIFDFVVVDTPAAFSEHVLTAIDVSSQLVLLTTPDVPALKNLRVTLDMLDLLSYPRQIRSVVVNRSDSKVGLSLEHVERVVRCPISGHIPSSRAVPISINKGMPITLETPATPSARPSPALPSSGCSASRPEQPEGGGQVTPAGGRVGMSLSDRLSQHAGRWLAPAAGAARERPGARPAICDPFGPLKRSVHEALLETLGPKLYDAHLDQRELEQQVTQTLQAVLQRDETPMTAADRVRVAQEVADDILGHGPLEPYLRDPDVSEIMVNGHDQIYVERDGLLYPVAAAFTDEAPPAPHDRQDRGPGRPASGRVQPHGGRPAARRQPDQRGGAASGARRLAADDPQVRRRAAHGGRTSSITAP